MQGRCMNGDKCDYLHAHIEDRIPICIFFKKNGHCDKGDRCLYRHYRDASDIEPANPAQMNTEPCPYYDRGFCHKGPDCKFFNRHFLSQIQYLGKPEICASYLAGFCPYGPKCNQKHLKLVIIDDQASLKELANFPDEENWKLHASTSSKTAPLGYNHAVICHNCGQKGHKATYC